MKPTEMATASTSPVALMAFARVGRWNPRVRVELSKPWWMCRPRNTIAAM